MDPKSTRGSGCLEGERWSVLLGAEVLDWIIRGHGALVVDEDTLGDEVARLVGEGNVDDLVDAHKRLDGLDLDHLEGFANAREQVHCPASYPVRGGSPGTAVRGVEWVIGCAYERPVAPAQHEALTHGATHRDDLPLDEATGGDIDSHDASADRERPRGPLARSRADA